MYNVVFLNMKTNVNVDSGICFLVGFVGPLESISQIVVVVSVFFPYTWEKTTNVFAKCS